MLDLVWLPYLGTNMAFKKILIINFFCLASMTNIFAAEQTKLFDLAGELPDISPELERREVNIPNIDALDIELGLFGGILNVEDFGANYFYGVSGFFHITEDVFLNANYGRSRIKDDTFRRLNLPLFGESGKRDISEMNFLLGWNFLSGEMFWNRNHAYTADLYLVFGAGRVNFDKEDYFNLIGGLGAKILFTDWLALRFEAKVSEYESSFLGYEKKSHNIDAIAGFSVFY